MIYGQLASRAREDELLHGGHTLAEEGLPESVAQQHKLAHRGLAFNAGAAITAQGDTLPEVTTTTGAAEHTAVTTIRQYTAFANDTRILPQTEESNASLPTFASPPLLVSNLPSYIYFADGASSS